jgi:hypothetical protein
MDNFGKNLNDEFKKNTTLYKEERNIANKEKIENKQGLNNAYRSPNGLYKTGKTLYISGTGGKDGSLGQMTYFYCLLEMRNTLKNTKMS